MDSKKKWQEKAFEHFANCGPESINIKQIAKEIGVARTTFYYHFADKQDLINSVLELYYEVLDDYVAKSKKQCKKLMPDLFISLAGFELGFKFSRQLFLNRKNPVNNTALSITMEKTNEFIIPLFIEYYKFNVPHDVASKLWSNLTDTWFSRLDPENITAESLQEIAEEIMVSLMVFMKLNYHKQKNNKP